MKPDLLLLLAAYNISIQQNTTHLSAYARHDLTGMLIHRVVVDLDKNAGMSERSQAILYAVTKLANDINAAVNAQLNKP